MIFKAPRYKFCLFGCFCFYWKIMNVAYIFIYICLHLLLWDIPVCLSVIFFSLIFIYGHIYLYVSTLCSWFTVFFNSIYYSLYCTAAEPWPDGVTLYQQYQGEVYIIAFFNDTYTFSSMLRLSSNTLVTVVASFCFTWNGVFIPVHKDKKLSHLYNNNVNL